MLITMAVLPAILGVSGIWLATPAAELMAFALSAAMYRRYKTRYGYGSRCNQSAESVN